MLVCIHKILSVLRNTMSLPYIYFSVVPRFQEKTAADVLAIAALRKELASRPTVSEVRSLRQQLRVLQQLEFNADNEASLKEGGTDPLRGSRLITVSILSFCRWLAACVRS